MTGAAQQPPAQPPVVGGMPAADLLQALALFAVDPAGTGVRLRMLPGEPRRIALDSCEALLGAVPRVRVPLHVSDDRLLGGLELTATLRTGRPVIASGLLEAADGGIIILPMAERADRQLIGKITAAQDRGEVILERDGVARRSPTRFGILAIDEGLDDEEVPAAALRERLALHLDGRALSMWDMAEPLPEATAIEAARALLPEVRIPAALEESLCATALLLGLESIRAAQQTLCVARCAAALDGVVEVDQAHAELAVRLALVPRATRMPAPPQEETQEQEAPEPPPPEPQNDDTPPEGQPEDVDELTELLLEAAAALLPEDLLARMRMDKAQRQATAGTAGAMTQGALRGRPVGIRAGAPQRGERLNAVETLRAAAPWQQLRRGEAGSDDRRVRVRPEDFRITRHAHRSTTTTVFVVDASGSAAAQRLAEAKGAVEILLMDCYVRRDEVALVAFRGSDAELLLPPTRSLLRARRSLAGLPGGGGTPMALGIRAALTLAMDIRRRGATPVLVFLSDGRANITLDGVGDRAIAQDEALRMARQVALAGIDALFIDTSRRPDARARELAEAMAGLYQPLPLADARAVSRVVQSVTAGSARG